METALFLIQAPKGMPKHYACLKNQPHVLLSYEKNTLDTTIHAPHTTWTTGRNRLYEYVKENKLDNYRYYVFLDDDLAFHGLSFHYGMSLFLSLIQYLDEDPPLFIPRFRALRADLNTFKKPFKKPRPKQKTLYTQNFQTVAHFDGSFHAFSKEAFFAGHLLPYTDKYDHLSWWLSGQALCFKANYYYPDKIIRCNALNYFSVLARPYERGYEFAHLSYQNVLEELGVDDINISEIRPVKIPDIPSSILYKLALLRIMVLPPFRNLICSIRRRILRSSYTS